MENLPPYQGGCDIIEKVTFEKTTFGELPKKFEAGTPPIAQAMVEQSYPSVLKAHGYKTGFVGKFGVQFQGGTQGAFDFFHPINRGPYFKPQPDGSRRHTTQLAGDAAIKFIQENRKEPFMLSVSFNATHAEDNDKFDHFRWPKVVSVLIPSLFIAIERYRIINAITDRCGFNLCQWFLEFKFGCVNANNYESIIRISLMPGVKIWQSSQAVHARVTPEVEQDDFTCIS